MAQDSEEVMPAAPAGLDRDGSDGSGLDAPASLASDRASGVGLAAAPPVEPPLASITAAPPRPWGFWATMAWSAAAIVLLLVVQIVVLVVMLVAAYQQNPKLDVRSLNLTDNGSLVAISTIVAAPVCVGLILLLIYAQGCPIGEYLGWRRPSAGAIVKWAAVVLGFAACCDLLHWLLRGSIVPPWMVEVYKTTGSVPLLVFALLAAAPVFEELLFRGFMFHGIASSRLGAIPAVLITAAAWAVIHVQYDWLGVGSVFLSGILLGIARLKTRSVILTMLLHSLQNLMATIELVAHLRMTG